MATGGSGTSLRAWLQFLHIEKYYDHLSAMGHDTRSLAQLSDSELAELGLPLGPRKKIRLNAGLMLSSCSNTSCNTAQIPSSNAIRQAPVPTDAQTRHLAPNDGQGLAPPGPDPTSSTATNLAQQHRHCQLDLTMQHRPAAQQVMAPAQCRQHQPQAFSARPCPTTAPPVPAHGQAPGVGRHDHSLGIAAHQGENPTGRRLLARASWPESRRVATPTGHPPATAAMASVWGPAARKACHTSPSPSEALDARVNGVALAPRNCKDSDPSTSDQSASVATSSAVGSREAPARKPQVQVADERASLARLYPLDRQPVHPAAALMDRPVRSGASGSIRDGHTHDTDTSLPWQTRGCVLKRFRSWDGSATCTLPQGCGSRPGSASSIQQQQADGHLGQGHTLYTAAASALPVDCSFRAIKKAAAASRPPQPPSDLQVVNHEAGGKTGNDPDQGPQPAGGAAVGQHAGASGAEGPVAGCSLLDDPRNFETPELLAQLLYDESSAGLTGPAAGQPRQNDQATGPNDTARQAVLAEGGAATRHQRLARLRALREEVAATERLLETLRRMVADEEAALGREDAAGATRVSSSAPRENQIADMSGTHSNVNVAPGPVEPRGASAASTAAAGAGGVGFMDA